MKALLARLADRWRLYRADRLFVRAGAERERALAHRRRAKRLARAAHAALAKVGRS